MAVITDLFPIIFRLSILTAYTLSFMKKILLLLFITITNTTLLQAQNSPFVNTINNYNYYITPANHRELKVPFITGSKKNEWFKWEQKNRIPADTIILNQRFKPTANPLLLWKKDYPLTPEQIEARRKQKKQDESVPGILLKNRVKKNNSPVIPTL